MTRLPPADGQWIDRESPVEFRFEGRTYRGFQGDVVTSALWASSVRLVGRSFKYHRPRGTYSVANHDINAMFANGKATNLRGDVLPLEAGLDLRGVNTLGGVRRDWLRFTQWAARMMPVGFYYKAFHTPRKLFPFYENADGVSVGNTDNFARIVGWTLGYAAGDRSETDEASGPGRQGSHRQSLSP